MKELAWAGQLKNLLDRNSKLGLYNKNTELSPSLKLKIDFRYPIRGNPLTILPITRKIKLKNNAFEFVI